MADVQLAGIRVLSMRLGVQSGIFGIVAVLEDVMRSAGEPAFQYAMVLLDSRSLLSGEYLRFADAF